MKKLKEISEVLKNNNQVCHLLLVSMLIHYLTYYHYNLLKMYHKNSSPNHFPPNLHNYTNILRKLKVYI